MMSAEQFLEVYLPYTKTQTAEELEEVVGTQIVSGLLVTTEILKKLTEWVYQKGRSDFLKEIQEIYEKKV